MIRRVHKSATNLFRLRATYRTPQSHFMVAHSTDVHYIDEGPHDSAVTVILLSCQWLGASHLSDWAVALPRSTRVIRIDLPGQGLTGPFLDTKYHMRNYADLLEAVLRRLRIKRYVLVGTSFSGVPAIMHASNQPKNLAALVLANASGLPHLAANERKTANLGPPVGDHATHGREFYADKLGQLLRNPRTLNAVLISEVMEMNNLPGRLKIAYQRAAAFRSEECLPLLRHITAPVLVQWSTHSTYLKHDLAHQYASLLVNADTRVSIFQEVGHLILRDAPIETAKDLTQFLATLS